MKLDRFFGVAPSEEDESVLCGNCLHQLGPSDEFLIFDKLFMADFHYDAAQVICEQVGDTLSKFDSWGEILNTIVNQAFCNVNCIVQYLQDDQNKVLH